MAVPLVCVVVELGIRGHDVNACWYCNVIAVDIAAQCCGHVIHERSAPVGSQPSDFLRDRKRCEMTRDKLRRQWQPRHLDRRTNTNIPKAGRGDERVQLHDVIERIGRSRHCAGALAHVSFERIGGGRAIRAIRDGGPDRERYPATVTSRLALVSVPIRDVPVMFPPGRARLSTRPEPTGSPTKTITT